MKTSKKILSFFLAVVMVVTTCSVGFSAFAAEKDTTIWATEGDAQSAYAGIDGLINEYVPPLLFGLLGDLTDPIYVKYAKMHIADLANLSEEKREEVTNEVKSKTTIADILEALSPMLASQDMFGLKMSKEDFASTYANVNASALNPLDEFVSSDGIDFYTFYNICYKMLLDTEYITGKDDGIAVDLSDEAKEALRECLIVMQTFVEKCTNTINEVDTATTYARELAMMLTGDYSSLSLEELKQIDFMSFKIPTPDGNIMDFTDYVTLFVSNVKATMASHEAKGLFPENASLEEEYAIALYYDGDGAGNNYLQATLFDKLLETAGASINIENKEIEFDAFDACDIVSVTADNLTMANCREKLEDQVLAGLDMEDNAINRSKVDTAIINAYYEKILMGEDNNGNIALTYSNYYSDFLIGAAVLSGKYASADAYNAAYNRGYTDLVITKEQRIAIANDMKEKCSIDDAGQEWDTEKIAAYLRSSDNEFAKYYGGTFVADMFAYACETGKESYRNNILSYFGGAAFSGSPLGIIDLDSNTSFDTSFANAVSYSAMFGRIKLTSDAYNDNYIIEDASPIYSYYHTYYVFDIEGYADSYYNEHYSIGDAINFTDEEIEAFNNLTLASVAGVEISSTLINKLIGGYLDMIKIVFNSVSTEFDIQATIFDLYRRLYENTTATIFELLPVLTVIIDEVLLPCLITNPDEIESKPTQEAYALLSNLVLPTIFKLIGGQFEPGIALEDNAAPGFISNSFDLNTILPNVLHWLYGKTDDSLTYYRDLLTTDEPVPLLSSGNPANIPLVSEYGDTVLSVSHLGTYTAYDTNGNELRIADDSENVTVFNKDVLSEDAIENIGDNTHIAYNGEVYESLDALKAVDSSPVFNYYYTFKGDVPCLTGVYIADQFLSTITMKDLSVMIALAVGGDAGKAVGEVVTEIGWLLMTAVDEFLADPELANQVKVGNDGGTISRGLNNIFVALPQLFDIIENLAADKYGVDQDAWVYCYDGRIVNNKVDVTDKDGNVIGENTATNNAFLEKFKSFAASNDKNRSVEALDVFVEILIENWLNAIFSLLNNVVSTDNEISNNLPIVAGLLNSLGGLGEQSILTDIFNSVFQITRDSEYSFTFSTDHSNPNNKLTGLSKQNAYFLIANIDRLSEVITNLIAHFGGNDDGDDDGNNNEPSSPSPVLNIKPAANAAATSHNYSANDLSNTKDLIGNLDNLLSSLLSDSTINDFSLNSTENLLAGVVSLLDRFLGNDVKLDDALTTDIVVLVNQYLYFITGESDNLTADGKKVNAKKVYTNDALTGLVVETYALIEKIADRLLNHKDGIKDFSDAYDIGNDDTARYNLLVEAIDGIIAPDAISIRLGDYGNAQDKFAETKYTTWTDMSEASSRSNYSNLKVDWGFRDGNKEDFYDGLSASLRLVTSILGVLFIQTGWYDTVLTPILGAFCDKNGIELESYEALKADAEATGYYDKTFLAIITPVSEWLNALLNAPASTLIKSIQGLAGFIDDNNTEAGTIKSVVNGLLDPIKNELRGAGRIFAIESDKLLPTSLTLQKIINNLVDSVLADITINIKGTALNINENGLAVNGCQITGNNLIPIINTALAGTGITLKQISWSKIYSSTPEAALVYVLEYVIETLLENKNLDALAKLINNDIATMIFDALKAQKIDARGLLGLLNTVLEATDSPTLVYWTFAQYLQELTENFRYPAGITKAMADQGVDTLDNLVKNIFPLLGSFGVNLGADDLKGIVDKNLFKNELLTKLAVALYGALDGLDPTIKSVLSGLGIVTSTQDVAKLLTDSSYGTTFSSAANTIKAQSSWSNVKNVNWGFTDGSAKAQQGFVNALAAILRPLNNVLNVFLNEGSLELNDVAYEAIMAIDVKTTTAKKLEIGGNIVAEITYSMKNGVLTLTIDDATRYRSTASTIKFDFSAVKDLKDLKIEGTNGYNSAIIPLLEAFKCTDIKTYSQYRSDVNSAKDNLLLDILNPIVGASNNSLLTKLLDKPFAVLTDLLPNIAMYLDAHGLSQLVDNLLAPVTGLIADIAETIDVNAILKSALGTDLNGLVAKYLGVKVNIDLTNLSQLNLEDLIIPLVNMLLADNGINIKLPNINWNALISLGDKISYTSAATGADGNYLTGKMVGNVDQGKVLITVLRYIAQVLTDNASSIKSLILGIDKLKNNKNYDMIASILTSVFNTIGTASADQIVVAIFYLVSSEPTNAFWDYTKYKTGQYSFAYPETVDVDFLKNLPPMLDGLVGGLVDLNGLIGENLFTDSLVSKLAKGLYGAIEGVKINDNMNLTALLAQTDIDFSTTNVANLLVDKDYGQTFESAASVIRNAGSWKNVNADALKWGVTDRDSFFHALVAVLRPIYGVLDVLLNDADLGLFNLIRIPGSNGYTSSIVPLMEAFSMYNIKTQYQYREDINKEYDAILLDIINPIWDKVEDILNAPIQTLMAVIPNLALFIGNDGLCQILDNLLTPVSALVDALRPIVDLNDLLGALLPALGVNLNSLLGKIGITNFKLDIYDLNKTLKQVLGGDAIIPLVNNILGIIKIGGTPLGLKLNPVDWLQLASHGTTIVSASQAATYGSRIFVEGDSSETLIAFLRYLINTINAGDNFDKISSLVGGLLGDNVASNVSDIISQVLGMLQGDTDEVISSLVDLLQTLA